MRAFLTLHNPGTARNYYDAGIWQPDTFYSLMAGHARQRPDELALRDRDRSIDWKTLKAWTDAMAAELRSQGLVQGDRVCIWTSSRLEAVVTLLACSREGYACNPSLHRSYTCKDVTGLLKRLEAAALVTEPGWGADRDMTNFDAELGEVGSLRTVYTPKNFPAPGDALTSGEKTLSPAVDNPDLVSYLAFTSGTTGTPKCVMHSCNTILANARDMVECWQIDARTRLLSLSPVSHHIAWVGVSQWLLSGCAFFLADAPAGMNQYQWIVETGATYVMGVPTHAMDVLSQFRDSGEKRFGNVDVFYMAGAPIPPSVAEAFVKLGITPQNVYGMTENSSHQFTSRDDAFDVIVGTCGRGGRAYEVRIFDPADSNVEVAPGETGQIGGRGGALMLGYYGNQEATAASFNDSGWFLSGDLGSLDAQGNLKIEGRLKDLIIRGGHNIYPAQIEALAVRHTAIEKAAAFPVADERLGEKVCLAVIGAIEPDDCLAHLAAEGLSKYDMPEYFLQLEVFPLTASGKILKRELVAMVRRGDLQPQA
ncbi:MAG: class I adenylate-forming enzyme family protein, partial [Burkholderiales bacterium]